MTAGKLITKAVVDGLAKGSVVWDREVRGFGARRQLRDVIYVLKYRIDRKQRFITIGKHGAPWTPDTARKEARRLLGAIHAGDDPAVKRDRLKREPTVAAVLDRYLSDHVEAHNKASTASEARRQVEKNIKPALGDKRISLLTRADVKRWHGSFAERPYEGNRALAYLRKALTLAWKDWELRNDNPALGVKMYPENQRERFFSDDELSWIGKAVSDLERNGEVLPGAIHAARLLALTGMRLSEVLGLRREWLDLQAGCLRLPDAKAGARVVPLGGPAINYLSSLERNGDYVCPGIDPAKPVSLKTFRRFWSQLKERWALLELENNGAIDPGASRAFRLLRLTEMAQADILSLQWRWIDIQSGAAHIPSVKGNPRIVQLQPAATKYLASLERIGDFVCLAPDKTTQLDAGSFDTVRKQLLKRVGAIDARPHDFRHTVGTFTAQTGANAFQVRDIMGHRTMAMTGRYVAKSVDPLKKVADAVASRVAAAMSVETEGSAEVHQLRKSH